MSRIVASATAVPLLLFAAGAGAQPNPPAPEPATLRGESTQTRKRLAEAEQKLLSGKAADAADDLQRLLDESGDDLVALEGGEFRAARWVAHSLLARLPPAALNTYQDRIEQPAKKLLDQAKRDRDPRPLWQLLDRYFVSRPAGEALLLLGDLLFERGEFREAEQTWRRLLPDAGADVAYPNSKADPALVRARVALALIFGHDLARAKAEVAALKAKHPGASGTLAGKTGPLADTLQAFLDAPPKLPPDATAGAAWPTFGGDPGRTARVPGGIPAAWPGRPSWRADIPDDGNRQRLALVPPLRPPFGYPAVAGGEVFVASGARVYGFSLRTGAPTREAYKSFLGAGGRRPDEPPPPDAECTLTAAGGRLYARLGPSLVRAPVQQRDGGFIPDGAIVCLGLEAEGKFTELWQLFPPEEKKVATAWEGAPLVAGRRMWAAYAKFEGGRVAHAVACYDPADADKAPARPAWTAELCDSPLPASDRRTRQELLTLAGRNLVFCSNAGAVVAIDATTGKRAWGFRYPRARKAEGGAAGEPSPAVAFGGRVFVAPSDGERVYALDSETGRLLWESPGETEGARILGVAAGRLVVSVAGPFRGIRGLDLDTGSDRQRDGGWVQGGEPGVLGYGRGLVTDAVIVWPSREGLFFLDPSNGWLMKRAPNPLRGPFNEKFFGHVAYADKTLVVVTPTEVWFYRAESGKLESEPKPPPERRFDALIDRAEREAAAGDPARATSTLADVAAGDLPAPFRAWAAARMLQLAPPATDPDQLPRAVRDALRPGLLAEWVLPPDGVPVTLGEFLRRRLGRSPAPGSVPTVAEVKSCAPGPSPEAEIDRTLKLPNAVSPLKPIPGAGCPPRHLFIAGPRALLAIPLDRGAEVEHAPADLFTHAAELRDGFVAAGPFAVALYGAARAPLWVFRMPATERLPAGASAFRFRCGGEPPRPQLSSFALAGGWLLARVGEYHLIALDLEARRVAWLLNTAGRSGYEPAPFPRAPRFGPHFALCDKFAVVQLSDGRRWFVRLDTGRPVALPALGDRTARAPWPQAPAGAGEKQLLLSDGPGLVRLAQLGGRVKWAFEPEFDEGYAGEPAQARLWNELLLVSVRRNHGVEIDRVDLLTGQALWRPSGPAFADADRIDLSSADADAERAYVPAANKLLALSLRDGKAAWEADLPDARNPSGWVVRAGKGCVIAHPAEAIPAEPPGDVWQRLVRSFRREPYLWRLPGLAGTLYDAWVGREVPVLFFDPETGKRLARLDIPARGPAVVAHFGAGRAVIATGSRVVWVK
jgi:outer membrane protein assembly factor BamB